MIVIKFCLYIIWWSLAFLSCFFIFCDLKQILLEKMNTTTIVTAAHVPGVLSEEEEAEIKKLQDGNWEFLNIPRRSECLDFFTFVFPSQFTLFCKILNVICDEIYVEVNDDRGHVRCMIECI